MYALSRCSARYAFSGYDVPVNDPLLVGVGERRRDLDPRAGDLDHLEGLPERRLLLDAGSQRRAMEPLHDVVGQRVLVVRDAR
jgi:hypothetical protein